MGVRKRAILTMLSRGCQKGALVGKRRVDGQVMGVTEGVGLPLLKYTSFL